MHTFRTDKTMILRQITSLIAAAILITGCVATPKTETQTNLDSLADELRDINVYITYAEPIDHYEVTMLWQPFDAHSETGLLVANFRDTVTNESFQYYEREKYSSYHTDLITFAEGFEGHRDGDQHTISTQTPDQEYYAESPLNYYASFQFFDVDFDGDKELLVNDWYRGQQGNYYAVWEITDEGLVQRCEAPFDAIDNCTKLNAETKEIIIESRDGYAHSTTAVYTINGDNTLVTEYDFTLTPAEGWEKQYDVTLKLSENGKIRFEGTIGRETELNYNVADFHPELKDGVITAPCGMLFFADLDFDGTKELITDLTPFAGSQRDYPAFKCIYRLKRGVYKDATKHFSSKCKVLGAIEPDFFKINPATKEIIQYCDGGYMSSSWEIYTYARKRYRYDRRVHYDRDIEQPMLTITITDSRDKLIREFRTTNEEFDKDLWTY